jgi:hypothetical protein
MKRFVLPAALLMLFILGIAGIASAAPVYVEGINDNEPVAPGWYCDPMKEIVFLYTPNTSYDLAKVEFYTHSGSGDFTIRVREDNAGVPQNILGEVTFQLSGSGFQGGEFSSPISLVAGRNYWVGFYSQYETGSHFSVSGTPVTEYVDWDLDGIWDVGPMCWLTPMMKFYSAGSEPPTDPGDFSGDGEVNAVDIDLLYDGILNNSGYDATYDLNGDNVIDQGDMDYLIHDILHTEYGDADLSGTVDEDDFNYFWFGYQLGVQPDMPRWSVGDFDGSGAVDEDDFSWFWYGYQIGHP